MVSELISVPKAWLISSVLICFIPYGLPSPSYNTIALLGLFTAVATTIIIIKRRATYVSFIAISSLAWTATTIAYPPMLITFFVTLLTIYIIWKSTIDFRFIIAACLAQIIGWILLLYFLTPERLLESYFFLNTVNDVSGLKRKLTFSLNIILSNPEFSLASIIAVLLGFARSKIGELASIIAFSLLAVVPWTYANPALFLRSHDIIALTALFGLGYIKYLFTKEKDKQIVAFVILIGFLSACMGVASAFNSIYAFPVFGSIASFGTLLSFELSSVRRNPFYLLPYFTMIVGLLNTSLFSYYGTPNNTFPNVKIERGPFSGLYAIKTHAEWVNFVYTKLNSVINSCETVAFFGRVYGSLLMLPNKISMPAVFTIDDSLPGTRAAFENFYLKAENLPNSVILYSDDFLTAVNPIKDFNEKYVKIDEFSESLGKLTVYRLRPDHIIQERVDYSTLPRICKIE